MMPNNKNSQTAQSSKALRSRKPGGGFLIGLFSLLGLMLAGTAIALGYYSWLELNKRLDQAAVNRQSIAHDVAMIDKNVEQQVFKKQMQKSIAAFDQQFVKLSRKIEQQAGLQEKINKSTQEAIAYVNRSRLGWGLREAEHVLRMANHRLHIEQDADGAITALNAASSLLRELKDERLLEVRESISKQVGKLKNFPYPDWVGISLHLDNVLAGLKRKLIKNAQRRSELRTNQIDNTGNNKQKSGWEKLVENIKRSINNSVTITHEEQKMKLFISQQERQGAYEFLRLKLIGAKYAVTNRNNETYHRELGAALAWLENKGMLNNNELIGELEELNGVNLEPELPNITKPSILLLETMESIENS